jgi:tRNA-Thr(GGU) m(6)t(6)A37 methyltransferase TsaA
MEPILSQLTWHAIGHVEVDEPGKPPSKDDASSLARIVLEPEFTDGLTGLGAGDRLMVIFIFHRSRGHELLQHPRGDRKRPRRGVFALRSPRRPNPIGASVVEIVNIDENVVRVRGLDAIDGTPVLDLKPAMQGER